MSSVSFHAIGSQLGRIRRILSHSSFGHGQSALLSAGDSNGSDLLDTNACGDSYVLYWGVNSEGEIMPGTARALAFGSAIFLLAAAPAYAQKSGGVLKFFHRD